MLYREARAEYEQARRLGIKEKEELSGAQKPINPAVLDDLLPDLDALTTVDLGVLEIPSNRIIGTRTAGRITAFTPSFLPLLDTNTEFATKWMSLCIAHMGAEGIREPIVCYEYLGEFYVQEGNKRVSVLRHFGAPAIPARVFRVLPAPSEDPRIRVYEEFLEFYKLSRSFTVRFRKSRDYEKLQSLLGKEAGEKWTEEDRRIFNARFSYFCDALRSADQKKEDILPEEALLLWLGLYTYESLSTMSTAELKKSVAAMWDDIVSASEDAVKLETSVQESRPGIISRLISPLPDQVRVAFIHQKTPAESGWTTGHEHGREYLEQALGTKAVVSSYMDADTPELVEQMIDQAIAEGAQVIFTTVPQMGKTTLKAALKYPKVFFFNCSLHQPYASVRTYYGRIYEAKFITGAIAGAMARDDRIGYIASYPIYGVPAAINAFALGAQMTNPRARIELRWSCLAGTPQADFFADGIRVISNRDVPVGSGAYLDYCSYGTYQMDEYGKLIPLASPVWHWGKFYESIVRAVLTGSLKRENEGANYWLGMDGGYIDIDLSEKLPSGVLTMAQLLKEAIQSGKFDPFYRRILTQDGTVINDGNKKFTTDELIHMDWLCENVVGSIPRFEELLPMSRNTVRELGIYKDELPTYRRENTGENSVHN